MELFDAELFRFIKKSMNQNYFNEIFLKAYHRILINNAEYILKKNHAIIKLSTEEIEYFYSNGRILHIVTHCEEYQYYDKLDEAEQKLKNKKDMFMRVHKSYLINMKYIKNYEYSKVLLKDNFVINISVDKRNEVKKLYF